MITLVLLSLIALFTWGLVFMAAMSLTNKAREKEEQEILKRLFKQCPPHPWSYEKDYSGAEIMICKSCRKRPGNLWDDYDKPY